MKNRRSNSWKTTKNISSITTITSNKMIRSESNNKLEIKRNIIINTSSSSSSNTNTANITTNTTENNNNNNKLFVLSNNSSSNVKGAEEWLAWCTENKVLVGQTIELTHYEIEACRRHFTNLKFHPSDEGVHPKTLADSFYRAEVFPTFNEALLFCQKLGKNSDSLLTFTDLLNCVHGTSIFKRNKVTGYMKFVASSELFQHLSSSHHDSSIPQQAIHHLATEISPFPPQQSLVTTLEVTDSLIPSVRSPRVEVNHSNYQLQSHHSQSHFHQLPTQLSNSLSQSQSYHSQQQQQQQQQQDNTRPPSRSILSNTIQSSKNAFNNLVSNATGLLNGIFTITPTPAGAQLSLVPRQRKTEYQRQESGETFRNYNLSSKSISAILGNSGTERPLSPSINFKIPSPKLSPHSHSQTSVRPELKKQDSGEHIRPAVRFKSAALKVHAVNRFLEPMQGLVKNNQIVIENNTNHSSEVVVEGIQQISSTQNSTIEETIPITEAKLTPQLNHSDSIDNPQYDFSSIVTVLPLKEVNHEENWKLDECDE